MLATGANVRFTLTIVFDGSTLHTYVEHTARAYRIGCIVRSNKCLLQIILCISLEAAATTVTHFQGLVLFGGKLKKPRWRKHDFLPFVEMLSSLDTPHLEAERDAQPVHLGFTPASTTLRPRGALSLVPVGALEMVLPHTNLCLAEPNSRNGMVFWQNLEKAYFCGWNG